MLSILYFCLVLHQDTTQNDSGVVSIDSILCWFGKNLLDKSTTPDECSKNFWIFAEGSDNKLTIGLVPNASYESNQIYPGQVKITDGKFDTLKEIRLRRVFWLADFSSLSLDQSPSGSELMSAIYNSKTD